jgi:hypothetical protein
VPGPPVPSAGDSLTLRGLASRARPSIAASRCIVLPSAYLPAANCRGASCHHGWLAVIGL